MDIISVKRVQVAPLGVHVPEYIKLKNNKNKEKYTEIDLTQQQTANSLR